MYFPFFYPHAGLTVSQRSAPSSWVGQIFQSLWENNSFGKKAHSGNSWACSVFMLRKHGARFISAEKAFSRRKMVSSLRRKLKGFTWAQVENIVTGVNLVDTWGTYWGLPPLCAFWQSLGGFGVTGLEGGTWLLVTPRLRRAELLHLSCRINICFAGFVGASRRP